MPALARRPSLLFRERSLTATLTARRSHQRQSKPPSYGGDNPLALLLLLLLLLLL